MLYASCDAIILDRSPLDGLVLFLGVQHQSTLHPPWIADYLTVCSIETALPSSPPMIAVEPGYHKLLAEKGTLSLARSSTDVSLVTCLYLTILSKRNLSATSKVLVTAKREGSVWPELLSESPSNEQSLPLQRGCPPDAHVVALAW
jgi:hypothetical protein